MAAKASPKPKFLTVEGALKCQTANGELSLPLSVSFGTVRKLMSGEPKTQFEEFEMFMSIFTPEQNDAIDKLDTADAAEILSEYGEALAEHMKVSLGKSGGSAPSSTSTGQQ